MGKSYRINVTIRADGSLDWTGTSEDLKRRFLLTGELPDARDRDRGITVPFGRYRVLAVIVNASYREFAVASVQLEALDVDPAEIAGIVDTLPGPSPELPPVVMVRDKEGYLYPAHRCGEIYDLTGQTVQKSAPPVRENAPGGQDKHR